MNYGKMKKQLIRNARTSAPPQDAAKRVQAAMPDTARRAPQTKPVYNKVDASSNDRRLATPARPNRPSTTIGQTLDRSRLIGGMNRLKQQSDMKGALGKKRLVSQIKGAQTRPVRKRLRRSL